MLAQINTLIDVQNFANYLVNSEELSFYPDDDFKDYIKSNGEFFYTNDEAILRNYLMDNCFKVCNENNVEIYELLFPIICEKVFLN